MSSPLTLSQNQFQIPHHKWVDWNELYQKLFTANSFTRNLNDLKNKVDRYLLKYPSVWITIIEKRFWKLQYHFSCFLGWRLYCVKQKILHQNPVKRKSKHRTLRLYPPLVFVSTSKRH